MRFIYKSLSRKELSERDVRRITRNIRKRKRAKLGNAVKGGPGCTRGGGMHARVFRTKGEEWGKYEGRCE